jgi:cystathionine gamma-lyase
VGTPTGSYIYSRSANPSRESFEKAIAELESAEYALAFSSGMAATAAVLQGLAVNSHVVAMGSLYGGTHMYLMHLAPAFGIRVSFVDDIHTELGPLMSESKEKAAVVWIESPSNPTLSLVDIKAVADIAHAGGARIVVDNTFLSPYFQIPLNHGADIVLHSVTKYINGHSVSPTLRTSSITFTEIL